MEITLATWAHQLHASPLLWISMIFILGLLVGSFLNVVIHRVPIMLEREWRAEAAAFLTDEAAQPLADPASTPRQPAFNLATPRSACPKCGALITATQNIPVISYLILGGKCANCQVAISVRYPLIELATAALSATVAWKFGFGWQAMAALVLTWMLIALAGIDFDRKWLPDNMTLPLLWLGLLLALAGSRNGPAVPVDLRSAVIGAAVGYMSLWTVNQAYQLVAHRPGMGNGDFKLLAGLGAWMGWQMLLPIILLSALAGSVVGGALILLQGRDRRTQIPFGPFLASAGWLALLWGHELVEWYLQISKLRRPTE